MFWDVSKRRTVRENHMRGSLNVKYLFGQEVDEGGCETEIGL